MSQAACVFEGLGKRLDQLSIRRGIPAERTREHALKEMEDAITDLILDLEICEEADRIAADYEAGKLKVMSSEEFWRALEG